MTQHALEHIEVATDLLAIVLSLFARVPGLLDVGSHMPRQSHSWQRREDNPPGDQPSNAQLSNASGGGHEQTRFRSPYAPSMRLTGGQYLSAAWTPTGKAAATRS